MLAQLRERGTDTPVLLMTGNPMLEGAVQAIDQGAVSNIAKPLQSQTLGLALSRAVRGRGVTRVQHAVKLARGARAAWSLPKVSRPKRNARR